MSFVSLWNSCIFTYLFPIFTFVYICKMEEIVKRICQILEEQQLSSSAFADTIGVQRSSISHVLSGRNKPSLEFILKIIRAFPSYSTDWLLFGKLTDAAKAYQQPADNTAENQVEEIDFTSESYDTPEKPTEPPSVLQSESEIAKVILLLKDGSFTEYNSKND